MRTNDEKLDNEIRKAVDDLPGVAVDVADDETVDTDLVKERTKTLNNNPRDTDGPKLK